MYCDWPELTRCCFCMPLRKGVLVFAYLNAIFCGFMIGLYSYTVHIAVRSELIYHGMSLSLPAELCIFIYLLEMVFTMMLIYAAHKKIKKYVKWFYYFAISTTLSTALFFIFELLTHTSSVMIMEMLLLGFAGFCVQIYLLILVWSLLQKFETDGTNGYENQLHQIINAQTKMEPNGIYNPSTIPRYADIV